MLDVLTDLRAWTASGSAALATVVATSGSAPRQPGAAMAVSSTGEASGSVSGGCVEGAVYELAREVIDSGRPVLAHYGISDDSAFEVGLTCGGRIEVYVERVDASWTANLELLERAAAERRALAVATVIEHPDPACVGARLVLDEKRPHRAPGVLPQRLVDAIHDDAGGLLASGHSGCLTYGPAGQRRGSGTRVFVRSFAPPPRLIVLGSIDFSAALAELGAYLGYRVTVCDARPVFTTPARLRDADEVVVDWPHRYLRAEIEAGRIDARTAICVLTHDPKFDVPALAVALSAPEVGFVGAMGSRRTHADRLRRLREAGLTEAELARLSSPIGLDLGGRTPQETAVSIAAELVAHRWGGTGARLGDTDDPIHADRETRVRPLVAPARGGRSGSSPWT